MTALLDWLCATPALPQAACRGRADLMDPDDHDEHPDDRAYRVEAAKSLCRRCPELSACRSWLSDLPAHERPTGVVAGRLNPKGKLMSDNQPPNPDANPPAKGCPDELAAGRAEFLRLCAALASGSQDGIANVLATLSTLHAAAWQLALQAAAREHVSVLGVVLGLEPADLAVHLEREAMAALDDAEGAADRLLGDGG